MHQFHYVGNKLFCEGVAIESLVKKFGTPLYVYSQATLADHYQKLGFKKIHEDENKVERWELDLNQYVSPQLPMKVTNAI